MRKMFSKFLEHTTIHSEKKLHLARHTVPSLMEDLGEWAIATHGMYESSQV
jgi:hypothetical protein